MAKRKDQKSVPDWLAEEGAQEWLATNVGDLKKYVTTPRLLYQSLGIAFVIGLAAHVGGYLLLASAPGEPLGLLADLLHALGWSLWTGVVVAFFVEVLPMAKRRQIKQSIDEYEAWRRGKRTTRRKR
jgi:hypothetical protein